MPCPDRVESNGADAPFKIVIGLHTKQNSGLGIMIVHTFFKEALLGELSSLLLDVLRNHQTPELNQTWVSTG
jgi:hypothetical protein